MLTLPRLAAAFFAVLLFLAIAAESRAADLAGRWRKGSWQSYTTSHRGPLKAKFTQTNDYQYHVTFRGRFLKIIPFRYSVDLDVVQQGDVAILTGSHYLGRMFGTFTYYAEATSNSFRAYYNSERDRGEFNLSR